MCFPSPRLGLGSVAAVDPLLPLRGVVNRSLNSQERLSSRLQHQNEALSPKAVHNILYLHLFALSRCRR